MNEPAEAFYHFIRNMERLLKAVPTAKADAEALKLFDEVRAMMEETGANQFVR